MLKTGAHASDLFGTPLSASDQIELSAALKLLSGDDFQHRDEDTGEVTGRLDRQAFLLWRIVKQDGWSSERFRSALEAFTRKKYWPNWSPADFLECSPEPDLHDRDWAMKECEQSGRGTMDTLECWVLGAVQIWRKRGMDALPVGRRTFPAAEAAAPKAHA